MATRPYTGGPVTLTAAANGPTFLVLGDADTAAVSTWLVEIETTSATYAITPRGRNRAAGVDPTAASPALPYTETTDATATVVAGSTPIAATTTSSIRQFKIIADGLRVALDISTLSAGTLVVSAIAARG